MGSNSMQARGLVLFLVGFVLLAAALAGGGRLLLLAGAVALAAAAALFLRCKPWEHQED